MSSKGNTGAIVITGASTGIGRASALHLAGLGYRVFAGVRKEADAVLLRREGPKRLTPIIIDVTDVASIDAARATVAADLGADGLAALVNNAGVVVTGPMEFIGLNELRRQMEVNLVGQIAVTQAFLGLVRKAHGRVVNIGSVSAYVPIPFTGAYAASKSAIASCSDALRMELKPWGIEVILIEPGAIRTPIWEKSRRDGVAARAELGADAENFYGGSLQALQDAAGVMESKATDPMVVAATVARAVGDARPKTRYLIGRDARAQALLRRLLPDRVIDRLVLGQIGLPKGEKSK
jgi:NAD(P)-dependent dehydrogenase (short-subunit alcohol dehydrogenase family)